MWLQHHTHAVCREDDSHFSPYIYIYICIYVCDSWSLTLREERRLRVFVNRALSRIFGSKRDEVTGEWRKLHNGT